MAGDISEHISRVEVICPCGGCKVAVADHKLVEAIEDVCDYFITLPRTIRVAAHFNSWNRCPDYDLKMKLENGYQVSNKPSEHTLYWATDFWLETVKDNGTRSKIPDDDIADYLEKKYPNSCGIGRYSDRTHLDVRPYKARWDNR